METRQSRILGENVQLLAFVTIFFLPLAFSAVSSIYKHPLSHVLTNLVTVEHTWGQ